jgi:hypothetical protein
MREEKDKSTNVGATHFSIWLMHSPSNAGEALNSRTYEEQGKKREADETNRDRCRYRKIL